MNENQNKPWPIKDDILLITSRHKGIDYQVNLLGRSRKAIKARLSFLAPQIEDTTVISAGDRAANINLMDKYISVVEWCKHIVDTYEIAPDDLQLLMMVFDCSTHKSDAA
jgi:hypothetical protein